MNQGNIILIPKSAIEEASVLYSLPNVELKERNFTLSPSKNMNSLDAEFIDSSEACHITGITKRTICEWCRQKKIVAQKIQGRWKINKQSLSNYIINRSNIVITGIEINQTTALAKRVDKNLVFISYSHKDSSYLKEFRSHINKKLEKRINFWCDSLILPGKKWRDEIKQTMNSAKVAVLLISANFFKSIFINEEELPPLLERAEKEGTTIMSVYLKYCDYTEYPEVTQYQAVNSPEEPVSELNESKRDRIWVQLIRAIRDKLENNAPNKG